MREPGLTTGFRHGPLVGGCSGQPPTAAEEAAQEAFAIAAERWQEGEGEARGVPATPGVWLVTTARNRAIDRIRRERTLVGKIHLLPVPEAVMDVMDELDDTVIKDERLELIFTCCHPALPLEGQVALTLRALGGPTVEQMTVIGSYRLF